jgi:uncharacterized Zn finger protein
MEKYLKRFDSKRKTRGLDLYKNNYVKYVIKYNNVFYSKVLGTEEYCYHITINNNNFNLNCNCNDETLCKHIYATLLSINDNKFTLINLKDLSKDKLLELVDFCISKDINIFNNIEKFINKQKNNITCSEIEKFFQDFEYHDFKNLIDDDYEYNHNYDDEYDEDKYEEYDDDLIDILNKINYDNIINIKENINKYVLEKIEYYNNKLDEYELINLFPKTVKYIENSEHLTMNDLIKLFETDYERAINEFIKIDNLKNIIYIYKNIKNDNKLTLLLNKLDNMDKYINDKNLYECLILIINESQDNEIIKKFSIIALNIRPKYDLFIKIKPLCNENELNIILDNIIKLKKIDNDIYNILYDYNKYDNIYDLIDKENTNYSLNRIYYENLASHIPDKISGLMKINIEKILDKSDSNNYNNVIEYLKIYRDNYSIIDFIEYLKNLLCIYKKKRKFKELCYQEFQDYIND